jgi:hypothetical protein
VWCYDGEFLRVHHLAANGKYQEKQESLAFPFMPMKSLARFLVAADTQDETALLRSFCQWVRETVAPMCRGNGRRSGKNGRKSRK